MKNNFQKALLVFLTNRVLLHFLFWSFIFIFIFYDEKSTSLVTAIFCLFNALQLLIPVYINLLILVPQFLKKRKWALYLPSVLVLVIAYPFLVEIVIRLLGIRLTYAVNPYEQNVINTIFFVIFTTGIKYIKDGIVEQRKLERIENQKLQIELHFLKSQLNPHFLFNTLNNFYGLAISKSERLPNLMLKLSELLRYMLYESNEKHVLLDKEIKYIESYIDLEKIRLSDKTDIVFKVNGNTNEIHVPPMLFITFIENAFKHFDESSSKKKFVHILLTITNNQIELKVENSIYNSGDNAANKIGGVGIENVKKRLDLLYKNKHELQLTKTIDTFVAVLKLNVT